MSKKDGMNTLRVALFEAIHEAAGRDLIPAGPLHATAWTIAVRGYTHTLTTPVEILERLKLVQRCIRHKQPTIELFALRGSIMEYAGYTRPYL